MITLGFDTSNYASSIAITDYKNKTVLLHKKQFLKVEKGVCGLRQQDAVFNHIKNLTTIMQLVQKEFDLNLVQAVGVSAKPTVAQDSYMPCFLVGQLVAQSVAAALNVPLIKTTHQDGHINSALFYLNKSEFYKDECIIFHISGGTTDIVLIKDGKIKKTIGSSKDLFAGQAIDRLGVKLGFDFPAGEYVSLLAGECDENIKPKVSVDGLYCNLSGLENQCDKLLSDKKEKSYVAKYCLSYIAYTIITMAENARKLCDNLPIIFVGGVMSSEIIKNIIENNMTNIHFVEPIFSQDNAIGVAAIAAQEVING